MAATYFILKAGIAPRGLASQPDSIKMMFWSWVVDLGLKRKDWELARGLNAHGKKMPPVSLKTKKHRRSEMTPSGRGDPSAPYLMPARGLSRTRSLLAGKAHTTYAEFFWRYDAWTGDQWGRILAHHARRGKAYDVVGLSPEGIASVAREAQKRWRQWLLSPTARFATQPVQLARTQPAAITPLGSTNLTHATFGIGATKEQAQKAIDEGRSSGFRTAAEWEKYFRQRRGPIPNAQAPSVRSGASNVLLQHVWSAPPRPPATGLSRAALRPTPIKPTPAPIAVAKPEPPAPNPPTFPASKARVEHGGWSDADRRKSEEVAAKVLGKDAAGRIASLVGAPDDAKVTVHGVESARPTIFYQVNHPKLDSLQGEFIRSDDGKVTHHVHAMYVKKSQRGKGFGARVHGRMAQFGAENGVDDLKLTAARGKEENGYITWPIFGYDGPIPESIREKLPETLRERTTIQELLADEEGQAWWKTNGESVNLTFPLARGSSSTARWINYWTRKLRSVLDP